jgi:hypothetical protein
MIVLKLVGTQHDYRYTWSVLLADGSTQEVLKQGVESSIPDARAAMIAALAEIVSYLEWEHINQCSIDFQIASGAV